MVRAGVHEATAPGLGLWTRSPHIAPDMGRCVRGKPDGQASKGVRVGEQRIVAEHIARFCTEALDVVSAEHVPVTVPHDQDQIDV